VADAARLEVRPQPADGAEKWADRARGAQARDALCHRSAPRAAPEAAPDAAELCTPAAVRFAERSCAAPEKAERPDAPQSDPPAEHSLKLSEALPREEPVPLAAQDAPALHSHVKMPLEARQPGAREPPEPLATHPETPLLAWSPLG
jgi:hypothetical protein